MTDDLRDRIAAVHQAHRWGVFRCDDGYARTCCRCQWRETPDSPTHAEHVADAVIRELQMTCEVADSSQFHCTKRSARRYVTAWFAEWVADE